MTKGLNRQGVTTSKPIPSFLNQLVQADEVLIKLGNTPNGRSSGIDGLPYEFYKHHQKLLAPVLASAINSVMTTGSLGKKENRPYPTLLGKLLPKKVPPGADAHALRFKRPLNIVDTDYRLASLVVNHRLSYNAANIITGNQTAFLKGRGIEENGITHYLIHELAPSDFVTMGSNPAEPDPPPAPGIPFMDRLIKLNVCLPVHINFAKIDIELQGYADKLDAFLSTHSQYQVLKDEWLRHDSASNFKMNSDKLHAHALTSPDPTDATDWRSHYPSQGVEYVVVGFPIRPEGTCPRTTILKKLQSIWQRAGFWSQWLISIMGRVQVANSLLLSTLFRSLQLCPLFMSSTSEIFNILRTTIQQFVLGGPHNYLVWKVLTTPKHLGGSGLIDPRHMCTAMNGRAILKTLLKSTQVEHTTNASSLLREKLCTDCILPLHAAVSQSLSESQQHEMSEMGIYFWIIRRGKNWREKIGLSPLMQRIAHTVDELNLSPQTTWSVHPAILVLPIHHNAYRPAGAPVLSKHARAALCQRIASRDNTEAWLPAYDIDKIGDHMGKLMQWGLFAFRDIFSFNSRTCKYQFRYLSRTARRDRVDLYTYPDDTTRNLHRDTLAVLNQFWNAY
ncbi:hypothetical protein BJ508DRAFT_336305 [Ascobolus immersus RN42]|uniref:Reverse transcriptase domain-containing protein n=1 Tax=Ascobolus immersus RN42 TaxID=1160509 RepID=A0A3N4HFJ0_ASCIM|nr:hypothetical protein BJ508DRAFT_336305 [Ascobolus immersus RN42]